MSPDSVEQTRTALESAGYICTREIATVIFLAAATQKPVLVEGPAGVGKTELAIVHRQVPGIADDLARRMVDDMAPIRRLDLTMGWRYASRRRGVLNVKKTLRRSARCQGVPVEIRFKKKPVRKACIVVLCDISGSVWSSARFMLNMIHSLQDCFERVRSFVFVAEVTRFFENVPVDRAIEKILTDAGINYGASTDYGLTLRQFHRRHLDAINKKTTLIIIGDGRCNYANPEGQLLEGIRDRCRRVVWLDPETEQFWYTGDSEMRTYQAISNDVWPCRNLNQLSAFIKELVL